jgi:hypothetical protein
VKESLVALVLKRIAPLLALFAAVLGLCVNCRADSLSVYQQLNDAIYGGCCVEFETDPGSSSGLTLRDTSYATVDFYTLYRRIDVPALPVGAVVTSATFSIVALSGTPDGTGVSGTSQANLGFDSVESLDPSGGPCIPPSCAPTIATVSVAYQYNFGSNCLGFIECFTSTPATGSFDLLSLGISPTYFADGFEIGTNDTIDSLWGRGASIGTVLYPGFNSATIYYFNGVGPQFSESVTVNYTLPSTVPEPSAPMLLIPGLLALAALKLKKATTTLWEENCR